MFENITKKITYIFKNITNQGILTKKNIKNTLYKVRCALINADVSLKVVEYFCKSILKKSLGSKINESLTPGQTFIKIVLDELISILGKEYCTFYISKNNISIGMVIGLQGSGKTSSLAKLAFILSKKNKKILITSIDIYRPAAIKQLKILIKSTKSHFFKSSKKQKPIEIIKSAYEYATKNLYDILLIDTPGSLHTDHVKIKEIQKVYNYVKPTETLFVVDSMIGQDAIHSINMFNKYFSFSGIIVTKLDSDTNGGVILSIRMLTKIPIKYIGTGEKIYDLQVFYPERIAKRILGMGDILSAIEKIQIQVSNSDAKKIKKTIKKNKTFNFNDFLIQIQYMKKIGGITSLISQFSIKKIPQNQNLQNITKKSLIKIEAMIYSMTKNEKKNPEIIKNSRKKRISLGSGITIQEINIYLKQFNNIKRVINKIKRNNTKNIFQKIKNYLIK